MRNSGSEADRRSQTRLSRWERRTAYRAPINVPVVLRAGSSAQAHCGKLIDVSATGGRVIGTLELPSGGEVVLEVTFPSEFLADLHRPDERRIWLGGLPPSRPPEPFRPLRINGKVVSARFDPRHRFTVYGISFTALDHAASEEIYRFVALWQRRNLQIVRSQPPNGYKR